MNKLIYILCLMLLMSGIAQAQEVLIDGSGGASETMPQKRHNPEQFKISALKKWNEGVMRHQQAEIILPYSESHSASMSVMSSIMEAMPQSSEAKSTSSSVRFIGYCMEGKDEFASASRRTVQFELSESNQIQNRQIIASAFDFGAVYANWRLYPVWAAWTGDKLVASLWAQDAYGAQTMIYAYVSYEPVSQRLEYIGTGNIEYDVAAGHDACYDYNTKTLYVLGLGGKTLYKNNTLDTAFTKLDSIHVNGNPINETLMTLGCSAEGQLFTLARSGKTYRINKATAGATELGSLGITPVYTRQSANFDRTRNQYFWAAAGNTHNFNRIDTITGRSETFGNLKMNLMSLNEWRYESNVPPSAVVNLSALTNTSNYRQVQIRYELPTLDANNNPLEGRLTTVIYQYNAQGVFVKRLDSILDQAPGAIISRSDLLTQDGASIYGVKVIAANGIDNGISVKKVYSYAITYPYTNGFEASDMTNIEILGRDTNVVYKAAGGRDNPACYELKGLGNAQLYFRGMQVKKGATYKITAWIKSTAKSTYNFYAILNNTAYNSTIDVTWTQVALTYLAEKDEQITFGFMANNGTQRFLLDDIKMEMIQDHTVPSVVTDLSCSPLPLGERAIHVNFKTPTLATSGEALGSLSGLIIRCASDSAFTKNLSADTLKTTQIGATITNHKISNLPIVSQYFVRVHAYNEHGISPYYVASSRSGWVGNDTVPEKPSCTPAQPQADGSIAFSWEPVTQGVNGGYLPGEIDYRVIRDNTKVKDTSYTTLPSFNTGVLNHDFYTFTITTRRDGKYYGTTASNTSLSSIGGTDPSLKYVLNTGNKSESVVVPFSTNSIANSTIAQYIITPEQMGGPCFIDTLHYYISPATKDLAQRMKIYFGYSDTTEFRHNSDWQSMESLLPVFDDSVYMPMNQRLVSIPIKGFYYDGQRPMAMTYIKNRQITRGATRITHHSTWDDPAKRMLYRSSTTEDYDTLRTIPTESGTWINYMPVFSIGKRVETIRLSGTVTERGLNDSLEGAKVTFYKDLNGTEHKVAIINSNAKGFYEFTTMPIGQYRISVSCEGYVDTTFTHTINSAPNQILNIALKPADRITLSGRVLNQANEPVSGVEVKAVAHREFNSLTNEVGEFSISDLFGATQYTVHFFKAGMTTLECHVKPGDTDTAIGDIVMRYVPVGVVHAKALAQGDSALISYTAPGAKKMANWCGDNAFIYDRLGAAGKAMKIAMRLVPGDIDAGMVGQGKLLQMAFAPSDSTAVYTLSICKGPFGGTPVYSKRLDKRDFVLGAWNYVDVMADIQIDNQSEWWLISSIDAGYAGFPLTVGSKAAVAGKGDWFYYNNTWQPISAVSSQTVGNAILGIVCLGDTITPKNGYRIFRGQPNDAFSAYTLLNIEPTHSKQFTDTNLKTLPAGAYRYAVCTDWHGDNISAPTYTNDISKDMEFAVSVQVSSNGPSVAGAKVMLVNSDNNPRHSYNGVVDNAGRFTVDKLWKGQYRVEVSLNYHNSANLSNITLDRDTLLTVSLSEIISDPNLKTSVNGNVAQLSWSMTSSSDWSDDFESYTNFAITSIGQYKMSEPVLKGGLTNITWPNIGTPQAYIVMAPAQTTPALSTSWAARSGQKYLLAMFAQTPPNNDYLIADVKGGGTLSFYVKGLGYNSIPDTYTVKYSTSGTAVSNFVNITNAVNVAAPAQWTKVSYTIPSDAKHIAIVYTSNDIFALMIDDLSFVSNVPIGNPIAYEVYLNNEKKADLTATQKSYLLSNLELGKHAVGVKAIYTSGASNLITDTVVITHSSIQDEQSQAINIYPNPAKNGRFTIELDDDYQLQIGDVQSRIVYTQRLKKGHHQIDLSKQPRGIYFIQLENATQKRQGKLIVID